MGNPFVHIELSTDDIAKAKKFYKSVFAWKLQDMKGGTPAYTMIDVGGGTGGGMMKKPMPNIPTAWLPYVLVDDVRKTLAKATKAGATIMMDYHEVGEMGAIGVFIDPTGGAIGIWEAKKKAAPKKASAKKSGAKKSAAKKK